MTSIRHRIKNYQDLFNNKHKMKDKGGGGEAF
jgi:hypothetical protein